MELVKNVEFDEMEEIDEVEQEEKTKKTKLSIELIPDYLDIYKTRLQKSAEIMEVSIKNVGDTLRRNPNTTMMWEYKRAIADNDEMIIELITIKWTLNSIFDVPYSLYKEWSELLNKIITNHKKIKEILKDK